MSGYGDPEAAVSAGVIASGERHRALLRSIVQAARAVFRAREATILSLDPDAGELVFEAVAGGGEARLVGTRFPAAKGLAGWVVATRQPLVLEDIGPDLCFAPGTRAASRGPKGLMAVPLLEAERPLGVLAVLDRSGPARFTPAQLELLGLFAGQAAIAVELLQSTRHAHAALHAEHAELAVVARISATLLDRDRERRAAGVRLLEALEEVLR